MGTQLSAKGERIAEVLPEAQASLSEAQGELRYVEQETGGIDRQRGELEQRHAEELETLALDRTKAMLAGYDPRLQSIIASALGNKDMELPEDLDLETCQRIAELDAFIKDSAGQPVVVINPDKDWVDFGMLQEHYPEGMTDIKGLIIAIDGPTVQGNNRIELPTYRRLAIDPKTGEYPEDSDDDDVEIQLREHRYDFTPRIAIDPTTTKPVLPGEKPEDYQKEENTTLVLVGYTHVRNVLNDILGFEPGEDEEKASGAFLKINFIVKQLSERVVKFDPDFIDGYLSYRIADLEREIQDTGDIEEADNYKVRLLRSLHDKHSSLVEEGWLR